jgi:hypothetical protein
MDRRRSVLQQLAPVTVLAGQTFQGRYHFIDTDYHVSPHYADRLIAEGVAVLRPGALTLMERSRGRVRYT